MYKLFPWFAALAVTLGACGQEAKPPAAPPFPIIAPAPAPAPVRALASDALIPAESTPAGASAGTPSTARVAESPSKDNQK